MSTLGKTCGISNAVTYHDFIKKCPLTFLSLKLEFELTVCKPYIHNWKFSMESERQYIR